jgi:2-polyprenyl-3-methyl-5-hydroxy-6-metoxy-1,4-benzoquinol methylase
MRSEFSKDKKIEEIRPKKLMREAKNAYLKDVDLYKLKYDKFQYRECPGCGQKKSSFFCFKETFTFERCNSCLSIFMNPGPTSDLVSRLYQESENYKYWAKFIYPITKEKRHKLLHRPRAKWIKSNISKYIQDDQEVSLVEIGAGDGGTLRALHEVDSDIKLYAFEPNPDSYNLLDTSFITSLKEKTLTDKKSIKKFSVLTSFEVLEHLLDPSSIFNTAKDTLKTGGLLMCSTPNALSLEVGFLKEESTTIDIEHISLLTPIAIFNMCKNYGFRLISIETPGNFDIELISASKSNKLFSKMSKANQNRFQEILRTANLSSHMKFVAIKNSE